LSSSECTPGVLRRIAGDVRGAQYLRDILVVLGNGHQPDADTDIETAILPVEAEFAHLADQCVGQAAGVFHAAVIEQDAELVTAEARNHIGVAHLLLQQGRELTQ